MVSTTLSTLAAGQSSLTSSENRQHQFQQQQQQQAAHSTITSGSATSSTANFNYQRSIPQQHNSLVTFPITPTTATTNTIEAQHRNSNSNSHCYNALTINGFGNNSTNNNNNNNQEKNNNKSIYDSGYNHNSKLQKENYGMICNGKPSNGVNSILSSSGRTTPTAINENDDTTIYETSSRYETTTKSTSNTKLKATSSTLLNLKETITTTTTSPPPVDDQISLLFPKCRPKQPHTTQETTENVTLENNCYSSNGNDKELTGLLLLSDADASVAMNTAQAGAARATTTATTANYYKNVNIITQSPPPHSTPSVSSESLSSVTPRISTNPFLCSDMSKYPERRVCEDKSEDIPESDPKHPYLNHYYFSQNSTKDMLPVSAEMPRKRVAYNPSYVGTPSKDMICNPSNPFLKDDYWEVDDSQNNCENIQLEEGCSTEVESLRPNAITLTNQRANNANSLRNVNYVSRYPSQNVSVNVRRMGSRSRPRYDEKVMQAQCMYENIQPMQRTGHHSQHYVAYADHHNSSGMYSHTQNEKSSKIPGNYIYTNKKYMERFDNDNCWENRGKLIEAEYDCERESHVYDERRRDRLVRRDWGSEHEPLRVRDWERDNLRNWETERDYERRREHDRERHYDHEREREREREKLRYREQEEIVERLRKHTTAEVHDEKNQENQQPEKQQPQKKANYSIIGNGEVLVFDDITEPWQNLKVTTEMVSNKTSSNSFKNDNVVSSKEMNENVFQEHKKVAGKSNSMSLEARHGIIEYEGSPRRIGQPGNSLHMETTHTSQKTDAKYFKQINAHNGQPHLNNNASPQLPARPGFPKRIVSPTRDCVEPTHMKQQSQQVSQHSKTQPKHSQSLPQQFSTDNNAEDTSNDVSEIGTISDLIMPKIEPSTVVEPEVVAINSEVIPVTKNVSSSICAPASTTSNNSTKEENNTLNNSVGETTATAITSNSETPVGAGINVSVTATLPTTYSNTTTVNSCLSIPTKSSTFDYLYEFSETRKVLEEFFKCPSNDEKPLENSSDVDSIDIQYEFHSNHLDLNGVAKNNKTLAAEEDDADAEDVIEDTNEVNTKKNLRHLPQQHHSKAARNGEKQSSKHYQRRHFTGSPLMRSFDFFLDSGSRSSVEPLDVQEGAAPQPSKKSHNNYSPETTDYDSNCGDLESLSGDLNGIPNTCSNYNKYYKTTIHANDKTLLSDHSTDSDSNIAVESKNHMVEKTTFNTIHRTSPRVGISMLMDSKHTSNNPSTFTATTEAETLAQNDYPHKSNPLTTHSKLDTLLSSYLHNHIAATQNEFPDCSEPMSINYAQTDNNNSTCESRDRREWNDQSAMIKSNNNINNKVFKNIDPDLDSLYSISVFHRPDMVQMTPPPPAPAPHRKPNIIPTEKDVKPFMESRPTSSTNATINHANTPTVTNNNRNKLLSSTTTTNRSAHPPPIPERNLTHPTSPVLNSPVWLPRHVDYNANKGLLEHSTPEIKGKNLSADEEELDTDLETDRLLGHQRQDDQGYYDENKSWEARKMRSTILSKISPKQNSCSKTHRGYNALLSSTPEIPSLAQNQARERACSATSSDRSDKSPQKNSDTFVVPPVNSPGGGSVGSGCISGVGVLGGGSGSFKKDTDALESNHHSQNGSGLGSSIGHGGGGSLGSQTTNTSGEKKVKKSKNNEGGAVLIEGVLFRAKYLGSTQLVCEGQPTKSTRMMQAEEAVSRIKALAPDGDAQPSTEVDLFISTEKIMVLNTDLKEIMMDHALRTISYIADIGDLVVLMARRRFVPQDIDDAPKANRTPKMICHVFESDEAQFIAQSIGQAFQVAYMEFLKANGIEDHSFVKEMDYQEVLNSQEIFGDELEIFAKKELQKEVVVPKAKGEILGVVIVESGWGSMLPTVVIANLMSSGAAARCGQLNIGDQLIAINGLSLVGLPLSTCQSYIKNTKNQTVVKFTVVPCAPVVEVKIKRPNTKYQLGFSVQNGVICSLLRGGIAERGGVRVGHRIIEINNQSVVAVPHEKIVNLLATSVGEILMKTMPTSMFRLLTGQENPIYI